MVRRKYPPKGTLASGSNRKLTGQQHAVRVLQAIYRLARSDKLLDATAVDPSRAMLRKAIVDCDTATIFAFLCRSFALQGVSDRVALEYMQRNGSPAWQPIEDALRRKPSCPKLTSYFHYAGCNYSKADQRCARPQHFRACPVPAMTMRSGRLNQIAFSTYLFIRDVANGDIVGWLKSRLRRDWKRPSSVQEDRDRLLTPLREIYGVELKLLSMALSDLLLAAPPRWRAWRKLGSELVVIDSLLHSTLTRTGVLDRYKARHRFGPACYRPNGCAAIVDQVSAEIRTTPRALSHAVWRYAAQDVFNICNGNRIDDWRRCAQKTCRLYRICDRKRLHVT